MTEKTKKLEAGLFQVKTQLERTSSAKVDEMLNLQKYASDRIGLGYDISSSNIISTSTTIFVPPSNNVDIENNDIKTDLASENIGVPPKLTKEETKNPKAKKSNAQKSKRKKQY